MVLRIIPMNQLKEIAQLFLKLGFTAFGGPASHIAMMHQEVVVKRQWMSEQHYLDLIGATNLIPGPNSTEMAIHIGRERAGIKGLLIAGLCFILPAVLITAFLAWLYVMYGTLPQLQAFIYGIKPAIIAVIIAAVYPMAKKSLKSMEMYLFACIAIALCFLGVNEIVTLFGTGALALLFSTFKNTNKLKSISPLLLLSGNTISSSLNFKLFFTFLKIGALLYGSGYVLFAFLDDELVKQGWLNREQLIDAIAVGQITPGPVFSSVTFIGYIINGWSGSLLATVAIFLPSFLFVALLNPLIPKMRKSKKLSEFLDAVNVASVALIAFVCLQMGVDSIANWRTIIIALVSLLVSFRFTNINSAYIVIGGSLSGYLLSLF